jgi:hypothetical protein
VRQKSLKDFSRIESREEHLKTYLFIRVFLL